MSAFQCPGCGNATGGDEKFCRKCGYALDTTCPECGHVWRYMFHYSFCNECGHKMPPAEVKLPSGRHHEAPQQAHQQRKEPKK